MDARTSTLNLSDLASDDTGAAMDEDTWLESFAATREAIDYIDHFGMRPAINEALVAVMLNLMDLGLAMDNKTYLELNGRLRRYV